MTHIPDDAWDWMDPDKQKDEDEDNPNDEYSHEDDREEGGENEGD